MKPTTVLRFERRLAQTDMCWVWTGAKDSHGYGTFKVDGRTIGAHRWSYQYHVTDLPAGLQLDHTCRTRACVNPWHLEPVTSRVNTLRGDGSAARRASQTHCKWGHEFTDSNTYVWRRSRHCRACRATRNLANLPGGTS